MSDGGRQPKRESKLSAWSPRKLFRSKSREPREEDNATSQDLIATSPLTQASNLPQIDGDGSSDGSNQVVQLSSLPLVPVASSNQSCEVPIEGEIVRSLSSSNGLATGGQLSTAWPAQGTVNISGGAFYKADNITLNTVNQNIQQVSQDPHPGLLSKVNETRDALQEERLFSRLQPSARAHYNFGLTSGEKKKLNRELCTPGTRKDVLEDIIDWVEDTSDTRGALYLLCGPAGSGKSTIACTIAHLFDTSSSDKHQIVGYLERTPTNKIPLGANFFCSRQFDDTNRVTAIAPTLAYQFALKSRPFADNLQDLDAVNHAVLSQLEKLLWKPLNEAISIRPQRFLLIIEAIDELGAEDSHLFLQSLIKLLQNDPLPGLKVFVTSREDTELVQLLDTLEPKRVYRLQDVEKKKVADDISTYLRVSLSNVDKPDLDATVAYSDGVFIIAATIVRYLAPHSKTPKIRARKLRALIAKSAQSPPGLDAMDDLYSQILAKAIGEFSNDPEIFSHYLSILHIFLSSLVPISPSTAASLANPTADPDHEELLCEIAADLLSRLHAVLYADQEGKVLSYHKSFSDYISDQKRSGKYYSDRSSLHARITAACFRILQSDLKFNMADIRSSFGLDADIADLKDKVKANISPSLSYCCQYWSHHLDAVDATATSFHPSLWSFLEIKALFWIEAMTLLESQGRCDALLRKARDWLLRSSNPDPELAQQLGEVAAFSIYFAASPASMSTPHLYISALATWPREEDAPSRWRRFFRQIPRMDYFGAQNRALMELEIGFPVWSVAISNDGTKVASAGKFVSVWDVPTGELLMTLDMDDGTSVAFSNDGTRLVTGSEDAMVRVWDSSTGDLLHLLEGHTERVRSVAFSDDGGQVVSCSHDQTVRIWDVLDGAVVAKLEGHTAAVTCVAFSKDGTRVASGSFDASIRVWDLSAKSHLTIPESDTGGLVYSLAFSTDGTQLVAGSSGGLVRRWDVFTGALLDTLEDGHLDMVLAVAHSNDGRIVWSTWDGSVRLWDGNTGTVSTILRGIAVLAVAFSSDGQRIVTGTHDGALWLWDVWTGTLPKKVEGHTQRVLAVAFLSPTQIMSGSADRSVAVWDAQTGAPLSKMVGGVSSEAVRFVTLSSDGTQVVYGLEKTLQLWDVSTKAHTVIDGLTDFIHGAALTSDRALIASGSSNNTVRIWKASTGEVLAVLEGHTDMVTSVAFSGDGRRLVSGSWDKSVRIWDVSKRKLLAILEGIEERVQSVAFSRDGRQVMSASHDGFIRVWNATTGKVLARLPIDPGSLECTAFSNDGKLILANVENSIWIWDTSTRALLAVLEGHVGSVLSAAFSSDGRQLVSGSQDGAVFVWDLQALTSSSPPTPPYVPERLVLEMESEDSTESEEVPPRQLPRTGWLLSPHSGCDRLVYISPTSNLVPYPATLCISRDPHSFLLPLDHDYLGANWTKCYTPSAA